VAEDEASEYFYKIINESGAAGKLKSLTLKNQLTNKIFRKLRELGRDGMGLEFLRVDFISRYRDGDGEDSNEQLAALTALMDFLPTQSQTLGSLQLGLKHHLIDEREMIEFPPMPKLESLKLVENFRCFCYDDLEDDEDEDLPSANMLSLSSNLLGKISSS